MSLTAEQETLVNEHLTVAAGFARRKAWRAQIRSADERDEMHADAMMGLVQAANKFRSDRRVPFKAFALMCIARAVRDGRKRRRTKIPTISLDALGIRN